MNVRVIRLSSSGRQRRHRVVHIGDVGDIGDVRNVGYVHHVHAIKPASPPREEWIMRPHRKPSDRAEAERRVVSEAHEEHERRRPHRPIAHKDRPRPPAPAVAVIEPASIMIRGPTPGLIAHPGPSPTWFPNPSARLIRRPTGSGVVGLPNIAIARHPYPVTVLVKIVHAGVIAIGA